MAERSRVTVATAVLAAAATVTAALIVARCSTNEPSVVVVLTPELEARAQVGPDSPDPPDERGVDLTEGFDVSGDWEFIGETTRGRNSEGDVFPRYERDPRITVELAQRGEKLQGIMKGLPGTLCGSGRIVGTVRGDTVKWTLYCEDECEGETIEFSGTVEEVSGQQTISGAMKPSGTPVLPRCWLPYSNLVGGRL